MMPGPDQVVECPRFGALAKYTTVLSGNTIGALLWTDGKQAAPMLPHPPTVVKCRDCGECFRLADASRVGTIEAWGGEGRQVDPAWSSANEVQEPAGVRSALSGC